MYRYKVRNLIARHVWNISDLRIAGMYIRMYLSSLSCFCTRERQGDQIGRISPLG
jgi:hypothetical protein